MAGLESLSTHRTSERWLRKPNLTKSYAGLADAMIGPTEGPIAGTARSPVAAAYTFSVVVKDEPLGLSAESLIAVVSDSCPPSAN